MEELKDLKKIEMKLENIIYGCFSKNYYNVCRFGIFGDAYNISLEKMGYTSFHTFKDNEDIEIIIPKSEYLKKQFPLNSRPYSFDWNGSTDKLLEEIKDSILEKINRLSNCCQFYSLEDVNEFNKEEKDDKFIIYFDNCPFYLTDDKFCFRCCIGMFEK